MLSLIAFWISAFDKLPTSVVTSFPGVDALFAGAALAEGAPDGGGADEPAVVPVFVVAGAVAVDEGAVPAPVLDALAEVSGCFAVGSGPQPMHKREVMERQTRTKPETRMA